MDGIWRLAMFNTILVPTDGSPLSEKAVSAAIQFAKENGSEIVALSVTQPYIYSTLAEGFMADPTDPDEFEGNMEKLARDHVEEIAALARTQHVRCRTTTARSFNPAEEIVEAAKQFHCDVIFMATHGRSVFSQLFAGSETQKVIAHADTPVMVFH